jgi:methylglutamate dehydrogenase subunit D
MADILAALPPGTILAPGLYGATGAGRIALRAIPMEACTLVAGRNRVAVVARAREAFGVDLIDAPRRSGHGDATFIGVGPGRWLVLSATPDLAGRLEAAFAPEASAFEQSGGLVVLEGEGSAMRSLLAKLVPLDLDDTIFSAEDAATTTAAHVNLTLWRHGEGWRFAVGRSYLPAFLRAFACAAAEYGLDWAG